MIVKKPQPVAVRCGKRLPQNSFRVDVSGHPFSVSILFIPGKKPELVGKMDEEKNRGGCFVPNEIMKWLFAAAATEIEGVRGQQQKQGLSTTTAQLSLFN